MKLYLKNTPKYFLYLIVFVIALKTINFDLCWLDKAGSKDNIAI